MSDQPRHVAIIALRRSGTTALWRLMRQDRGYRCYDEPFNPLLAQLPADNRKRTRAELIELFNRDPELFRTTFAPIIRSQETARGMSDAQKDYLRFLTHGGPTVFDETRCMGKIPDLKEVLPDAVLVHLYRHPAAFVSSHLLPSDRRSAFGLRPFFNQLTFFTRTSRFNEWGMEELLRTDHVETTRELFAEVGLQLPVGSEPVPVVQRLLTAWLGAYRLAELEGAALFGERFVSMPFERLCSDPDAAIASIFAKTGTEGHGFETSWLRPSAPGFSMGDSRWGNLALRAGFDSAEMARFFPEGRA